MRWRAGEFGGGDTVSTADPPPGCQEAAGAPAQVARLSSLQTGILEFPLAEAQADPGGTI